MRKSKSAWLGALVLAVACISLAAAPAQARGHKHGSHHGHHGHLGFHGHSGHGHHHNRVIAVLDSGPCAGLKRYADATGSARAWHRYQVCVASHSGY